MDLKLSQEQISQILNSNEDTKYLASRDTFGALTINEDSNFPERLKFYMSKTSTTVNTLVDYFRSNYPSLLSSSSSVHHYLRGIRTPKLSVLLGIAECLSIPPCNLLPGKPGSYMVKEDDHVELLPSKTDKIENSDDVSEFNPTEQVEELEMTEIVYNDEGEYSDSHELEENNVVINEDNNVVISDPDDEDDTDSFEDDTISIDEPSNDDLANIEEEIGNDFDSFDDIFSDEGEDPFSASDKKSDTMSWIKFTE